MRPGPPSRPASRGRRRRSPTEDTRWPGASRDSDRSSGARSTSARPPPRAGPSRALAAFGDQIAGPEPASGGCQPGTEPDHEDPVLEIEPGDAGEPRKEPPAHEGAAQKDG